jgi:23S rRNA (cytidine1920-2'-O)/16S rRNA (cytidine1409-2'-O)-methyltransferase
MNLPKSSPPASSDAIKSNKLRIDVLLVDRGLAPSRERAQALLMAGHVLVNSQKVYKPGTRVATDSQIELIGPPQRYASRGGFKLAGALEDFGVTSQGMVCLDIGSSTGGFTDCLLQDGASRVYAVDVSIDQLDWKLRSDHRVLTIEKNARYLRPGDIAEPASLVVIDVSFISVTKVLPAVIPFATPGCNLLVLIKPQFELEKRDIGKGGVVRDPTLHPRAIEKVVASAAAFGLEIIGVKPSRLPGSEGNQEFFLHARWHG